MADSYTTQLRILKMENGSHTDDWGTQTNTNWDLVEAAIAGYRQLNVAGGASVSVSVANGATDEQRYAFIETIGALTSNISVILVSTAKEYIFRNSCTGSFTLTAKCSGSTGVVVPQGHNIHLWCDGSSIRSAITQIDTINVSALGAVSISADSVITSVATVAQINATVKASVSTANVVGILSVGGETDLVGALSVTGAANFKGGVSVSGTVLANGAFANTIVSLTDAASIAINMALGNVFQVTLAGNRTLAAPTNIRFGQPIMIYVIQDATGGRTLTYNSVFKFESGTTTALTSTANAVDVVVAVARTSILLDTVVRNDFR